MLKSLKRFCFLILQICVGSQFVDFFQVIEICSHCSQLVFSEAVGVESSIP